MYAIRSYYVLGGDVLELVGLVEHDRVVIGQDARARRAGPHRQVGEVQVVVDQDQLGAIGGGVGEERLQVGASVARALV